MHVITYPCWDLSLTMLIKVASGDMTRGHGNRFYAKSYVEQLCFQVLCFSIFINKC